ncbi:hypothetical protein BJY04DRAFT_222176 [Aspergillus karnatakaensis]|uniref:uncharacterized protein n=1 Tax=Aspergillus karnatakaensis TaxID=1810916 RepID=UPI003CCCD675
MSSNGSFATCPDPFIAELSIGDNGGFLPGRWCTPYTVDDETLSCCFPCPFTDYRYPNGTAAEIVPWIGLAVLILMVISALTYILLPTSETQRHYLTSSPLAGFIFMSVAFIIPLGPSDHYCHDAITPNYWLSDTTCAVSGSFLHYGVWVLIIGCFFRSLSLYLQLHWDVEPATRFRTIALLTIFGGSLALLALMLGVSGVSYQVGSMCYISYANSIPSFWGPLIGVAFISFLIQIFIMGYCIRGVITRGGTARFSILIFKRHGRESSQDTQGDLPRPSVPVRHTSTKIWRIMQLQWRAIAIACLILLYVVYVAQAVLRWGAPSQYSDEELSPWVTCLINKKGDKEACGHEASRIGPNQATAVSALALLASGGFWGMICTVRRSMVIAWYDWLLDRKDDIVDCLFYRDEDSRRERSSDLERVSSDAYSLSAITTPTTLEDVDKLYGTRKYHVPKNSFSVPARNRDRRASTIGGSTIAPSTIAPSVLGASTIAPSTITPSIFAGAGGTVMTTVTAAAGDAKEVRSRPSSTYYA